MGGPSLVDDSGFRRNGKVPSPFPLVNFFQPVDSLLRSVPSYSGARHPLPASRADSIGSYEVIFLNETRSRTLPLYRFHPFWKISASTHPMASFINLMFFSVAGELSPFLGPLTYPSFVLYVKIPTPLFLLGFIRVVQFFLSSEQSLSLRLSPLEDITPTLDICGLPAWTLCSRTISDCHRMDSPFIVGTSRGAFRPTFPFSRFHCSP